MRNLVHRSTDEVAPALRARYWRDAVHDTVMEMDLLPSAKEDFHSHIELCALSGLVVHQAQGSPQRISRDRSKIARGDKSAYYLISQPRQAWFCSHAAQDHVVQPGESVLVDSRVPYAFAFSHGFDDLSVELPVAWVERWLAAPERVIGRPLAAASGWGLALRGVKEALVPRALAGLPVPDELLEDQLGALLALAAGGQAQMQPGDRELFERSVAAIRSRLATPGLVASEVARACSVSLRTLHRAFAAKGRTFAGVLMQERTEEAARLMRDRRFRHLPIAEIARRCGFLDASHFARQFRRMKSMGPRQFRDAACG